MVMLERLRPYLYLLIAVAPILAGSLYVYCFGVNVLYRDEWQYVPLFEKFVTGSLTFHDLFRQANEHRIVYPRLLRLASLEITQGDSVVQMYLTQGFLLLTLFTIYLKASAQFHFRLLTLPIWFLPLPFLIFSWRQWENLLWGMQTVAVMPLAFGLLSFYCLSRLDVPNSRLSRQAAFIMAILCAHIATFSFAMGLFTWLMGVLQLGCAPRTLTGRKWYLLVWSILGVLHWTVYFQGYAAPAHHPSVLFGCRNVLDLARYFLVILGSLGTSPNLAFIFGVLLCGSFLFCLRRLYQERIWADNAFWLAGGIYIVISLASIAVGRSGFGVEQALASRYASYSVPFILFPYVLTIALLRHKKSIGPSIVAAILLAIMFIGTAIAYREGALRGQQVKAVRESGLITVANFDTASDDELEELYCVAKVVRQSAPFLQTRGYNCFQPEELNKFSSRITPRLQMRNRFMHYPLLPSLIQLSEYSESSIDTINGLLTSGPQPLALKRGSEVLKVAGWAVDSAVRDLAGGVYIDVDGQYHAAAYGRERKDVAQFFKVAAYSYAGFHATIPLSQLGAGEHTLSLKILTHDQKAYYGSGQYVRFTIP